MSEDIAKYYPGVDTFKKQEHRFFEKVFYVFSGIALMGVVIGGIFSLFKAENIPNNKK